MKRTILTALSLGLSSLFVFCGCELLSTDDDDLFSDDTANDDGNNADDTDYQNDYNYDDDYTYDDDYMYNDYSGQNYGIISSEFEVSVTGVELGNLSRFDSALMTSVSIDVLGARARSSVSSGTTSPRWHEALLRATPKLFATTWHVSIYDDTMGAIVDECDVEVTREMVRSWRGFEVDLCGSSKNLAVQFSPVAQLSL